MSDWGDGRSWRLVCDDCLGAARGLPSLTDKSVGVVITDPPYSEHVHSKSMRGLTVTHRGGATDEIAERRDLGFESLTEETMRLAAGHFARVARRWVLVFSDVESSHLWREALVAAGLDYLRTGAWIKLGGAPQFTGDRPAVGFEAITIAHAPGAKSWNGGGRPAVWSVPTAIDRDRTGLDERMHTTQKPVALMEALVRDFTEPDELVLDAFAGSASSGVAALRLGRRWVGWEREESWLIGPKNAQRRVTMADVQRRLANTRRLDQAVLGLDAPKAKQGVLVP